MSLTIRTIEQHELEIYSRVLLDAVLWLQNQQMPLWTPEQVTPEALLQSYRLEECHLAFLKGQPVAGMILQNEDALWDGLEAGSALYVHKLAVSRTRAGQRLGREMLDFAREEAARRGKSLLRLDASARHSGLCKYYENYGFQKVASRHLEAIDFHLNFYQMPAEVSEKTWA